MASLLTALLFSFHPQTAPSYTDIQARIQKTPLVVSLALSGWKEKDAKDDRLRAALGDKVLFNGTLDPEGTLLTVIVEANEPMASPQTWRERFAVDGEPFDADSTPCVGVSAKLLPGCVRSDYHAYFATRTHVLDVHVSRMSDTEKTPLPRAEFERIVKSLRVLALRRGWSEDYPREIAIPMTLAAVIGVDNAPWQKEYMVEHAEDWPAHFANAEFLRFAQAAPETQRAAYDRALALITKVEKPDAKVRLATAMLYDGLSLALYDAKKHQDSIAPLEKGLALLTELGRKERSSLAYNLACAQALTKHEAQALAALAKAIEADPRLRDSAAKDSDLASLAGKAEFKKLITAPDDKAPAKAH